MTRLPLTWNGRLPGVAVQPAPPTSPETSLRLDVAGFVGFAERGPLDTPVMLEDMSQYRAVFGGEVFVARLKGQPVYGHLSSAVQAFFDNGGRRCYVVRVAGKSSPNQFPLAGLFAWKPVEAGNQTDSLAQVICPAASDGRWSDGVRTATRLRIQPLLPDRPWAGLDFRVARIGSEESAPSYQVTMKVRAPAASSVQPGDLLEMRFDDAQGSRLYCRIQRVEPVGQATAEYSAMRTVQLNLTGDPAGTVAFATRRALPPRSTLMAFDYQLAGEPEGAWKALRPADLIKVEEPDLREGRFDFQLAVRARAGIPALETEPKPKVVYLRLTFARGEAEVDEAVRESERDIYIFRCEREIREEGRSRRLIAAEFWFDPITLGSVQHLSEVGWSKPLPTPLTPLTVRSAADRFPYRLQFPAQGELPVLGSMLRLHFNSGRDFLFMVGSMEVSPREDGLPVLTLMSDSVWEAMAPTEAVGQPAQANLLTFDLLIREGRAALESWPNLRFNPGPPPAVDDRRGARGAVTFWADMLAKPLAAPQVSFTAQEWLHTSTRLHRPQVAVKTDDLDLPLFLPLGMSDRLATDDRFQGRLTSVNAHDGLDRYNPVSLFLDPAFIKPATLTQRRRLLEPAEVRAQANDMLYRRLPPCRPIKLHSLYAVDEVALIAVPDLGQRRFRCRARRILPAPEPPPSTAPGTFNPCSPLLPQPQFRWRRFRPVVAEPTADIDLIQRLSALPEMEPGWQPCESIDEVLMVHRALINLAAARADLLAVLSLPLGYGVWDVLDWHQRLTEGLTVEEFMRLPGQGEAPSPLDMWASHQREDEAGYGNDPALSYAAIWHGWIEIREEYTPQLLPTRAIPPDGPICGMIAARELARGPGVAPANQPLRGVVGLIAPLTDEQWELLFNRQVNVLHARPGKFITLSAYTLSQDHQLLQISVRRMLIFLRKLVYREGMRYVFESNNERFRRSVQTRYERIFDRLIEGGSLLAYAVDTGDTLNTFGEVDRGRFIIAIRVALTYPVEYITIVLLRTSETLLDVLER